MITIPNYICSTQVLSFEKIAELTNSRLVLPDSYSGSNEIKSVSSLLSAKDSDICFFNNIKYIDDLLNTKASACFLDEKFIDKAPKNIVLFVTKDPYGSFAKVSQLFFPLPNVTPYISKTAVISENAKVASSAFISDFAVISDNVVIGENTYIGPHVVISQGSVIGNNCIIHSNTTIKYAKVLDNCIIHEGVRIGQDGFGFAPNPKAHIKIPQVAGVIIGNNVEIGANACIDRGAVNDTIIGDGTKIDNMVQVAHGVSIGKGCFIASLVGIAGSATIEDFVSIGGHTGVAPHSLLRRGTQIAPMSGIDGETKPGDVLMGYPAINFTSFWRLQAILRRLLKNKGKGE